MKVIRGMWRCCQNYSIRMAIRVLILQGRSANAGFVSRKRTRTIVRIISTHHQSRYTLADKPGDPRLKVKTTPIKGGAFSASIPLLGWRIIKFSCQDPR
jgi:hypothetical protein